MSRGGQDWLQVGLAGCISQGQLFGAVFGEERKALEWVSFSGREGIRFWGVEKVGGGCAMESTFPKYLFSLGERIF